MLTSFKIGASLNQAGICLNGTGGPLFKTGRYLFQNRNCVSVLKERAHVSKQVGACFKQHIVQVEFTDQKFRNYGNVCFRIIITTLKTGESLFLFCEKLNETILSKSATALVENCSPFMLDERKRTF